MCAQVTRNWDEIIGGEFTFNRRITEANALKALKKDQLIAFYDRHATELRFATVHFGSLTAASTTAPSHYTHTHATH
jgi:secreted Zn-dependent insulinase-like peptidase